MPDLSVITNFIATDIRMATPILYAALGMVILNRSGLINIGFEGIMLIGSLTAFIGVYFTGNVWLGFLLALLSGAIMGLLFAYVTVTLRANQIVIGAAYNIFGAGITAIMFRVAFGIKSDIVKIPTFQRVPIPGLSSIPGIGPAIFNQFAPVYLAFILVVGIWYFLFKTSAGLNLRAVGENPKAADTLGVNVYKTRYLASIAGCAIGALGGAFLSTGLLSFFTEDMVAGRGYIALAAVVFGKYHPVGVLGAALLFGLGDTVQIILQATGSPIPSSILLMSPYILTIVALAGFIGKSVSPASTGKPYIRG